MKRSVLIESLGSVMKTDKKRWRDGAFDRAIDGALLKLSYDRPLVLEAELSLVAGVRFYAVPADFIGFAGSDWGKQHVKQWQPNYPGLAPRPIVSQGAKTAEAPRGLRLRFTSAPSSLMLAAHGACFAYSYNTLHVLTEAECTVLDLDEDLLFTACLMQLVKELIASQVTEPVQLHRGMSDVPREATPLVAYRTLESEYKELLSGGRDAAY